VFGEDLLPGAVNSLFFAQPHSVEYAEDDEEFAPIGEVRAEASYDLAKQAAVQIG
jgi:hypothetical protein